MSLRGQLAASWTRLWAIAVKEILQLRRDRLTLAMMAALPVMQLLLFGYAIDTDVRHMPTVVFDQDHSARSRDFAQSLEATGFYRLVGAVQSYPEIAHALRGGDAQVALVIPPGYERDLLRSHPAHLQFNFFVVSVGDDTSARRKPLAKLLRNVLDFQACKRTYAETYRHSGVATCDTTTQHSESHRPRRAAAARVRSGVV